MARHDCRGGRDVGGFESVFRRRLAAETARNPVPLADSSWNAHSRRASRRILIQSPVATVSAVPPPRPIAIVRTPEAASAARFIARIMAHRGSDSVASNDQRSLANLVIAGGVAICLHGLDVNFTPEVSRQLLAHDPGRYRLSHCGCQRFWPGKPDENLPLPGSSRSETGAGLDGEAGHMDLLPGSGGAGGRLRLDLDARVRLSEE